MRTSVSILAVKCGVLDDRFFSMNFVATCSIEDVSSAGQAAGAGGGGSDCSRYRSQPRPQLRLRHQPRPGPGAQAAHPAGGLGAGGLHRVQPLVSQHIYISTPYHLHLPSTHIYNIYTGGWSPYWPPMLAPWPGPGSTTSRWRPTGRQRGTWSRPRLWIRCIVGHLMFFYAIYKHI